MHWGICLTSYFETWLALQDSKLKIGKDQCFVFLKWSVDIPDPNLLQLCASKLERRKALIERYYFDIYSEQVRKIDRVTLVCSFLNMTRATVCCCRTKSKKKNAVLICLTKGNCSCFSWANFTHLYLQNCLLHCFAVVIGFKDLLQEVKAESEETIHYQKKMYLVIEIGCCTRSKRIWRLWSQLTRRGCGIETSMLPSSIGEKIRHGNSVRLIKSLLKLSTSVRQVNTYFPLPIHQIRCHLTACVLPKLAILIWLYLPL